MSLWKIAWRSIQQRSLASALTAVSMALGVALVVAVLVIHEVVDQSFRRGGEGYDLIVGAKGGELQLVLNSVYHIGHPVGNIPYTYYRDYFKECIYGDFGPDIETAVPICMGHNYRSYRVVGTVPEMFQELTYRDGQEYQFAEGRNFDAQEPFEAVVGATVARKTGLKLKSTFQATHGEVENEGRLHQQKFTVVGILKHTGTPVDQALFVNMDGFYRIHDLEHKHAKDEQGQSSGKDGQEHAHDHAEPPHHGNDQPNADPEAHLQVTVILVCVDNEVRPGQTRKVAQTINKGKTAQAAIPAEVIAGFFEGIVGNVQLVLLILAVLTVVVAGLGIMVSIYNSMSDRRHEIAVMRALGASRSAVMIIILLESILLSLGGGVLGLLLGHGLIGVLSPVIVEQTGVAVAALQFQAIELVLIPGLIVLASLVGYLPAVVAYRTDVAQSLTMAP